MMASDPFGDLRALLQRPPSVQTWQILCELVEGLEAQRWSEQIHPYVIDQLARVARPPARDPCLMDKETRRGHPAPYASICAHLDLSGRDITAASVAHLERSALSANTLRVLTLENTWSSPEALKRLYTCALLERVEHAHLSVGGVDRHLGHLRLHLGHGRAGDQDDLPRAHQESSARTLTGLNVYADFGDDTYLGGSTRAHLRRCTSTFNTTPSRTSCSTQTCPGCTRSAWGSTRAGKRRA